eukprot:1161084-Pelagomonas_calceolata.AAC.4
MPLRSACLLVMHERHGCLLCNLVQGHPPGELTACLTRVLMRLRPKTCLPDVPADALMTAYLTHLLVRLLTVDLMHMMPNIRSVLEICSPGCSHPSYCCKLACTSKFAPTAFSSHRGSSLLLAGDAYQSNSLYSQSPSGNDAHPYDSLRPSWFCPFHTFNETHHAVLLLPHCPTILVNKPHQHAATSRHEQRLSSSDIL